MDRNDRRFSITMPQELAAELAAVKEARYSDALGGNCRADPAGTGVPEKGAGKTGRKGGDLAPSKRPAARPQQTPSIIGSDAKASLRGCGVSASNSKKARAGAAHGRSGSCFFRIRSRMHLFARRDNLLYITA